MHYEHPNAGSVYSMLKLWQEDTDKSLEQLYKELFPKLPRPTAEVPKAYRYVYTELWALARSRKAPGQFSPNRLDLQDVQLLRELGHSVSGWELETFFAIDQAWLEQITLEKGTKQDTSEGTNERDEHDE